MTQKRILIIEDDKDLAAITGDMLQNYGYEIRIARNCEAAFDLLTKGRFHLLLMDINLPDGSGFDVCRELRRVSRAPVIFASARTGEEDKIKGFDMGGDDYLAKPYSLRELLARINALMRRAYGAEEEAPVYRFGKVRVDTGTRTAERDGEEVRLALREFDLLAYLCAHPDRAVRKEELLREVWGAFSEAEPATVAVHIRWLREKLEDDPASPRFIRTVWGVGYQLDTEGSGTHGPERLRDRRKEGK
ncbi:MAG: response regulator transcription factor [Blautia sp.]|nr:response regulator transcription factor [Blautia sp.]MCM1200308.1 response regulator transcription factor [Bacteroides fragilis]